MSEMKQFSGAPIPPVAETEVSMEVKGVQTKTLAEGESTLAEGEPTFTAAEVIAAIKAVESNIGELVVTEQIVSHDGVLLSCSARAPGSDMGYTYSIRGMYGKSAGAGGNTRTTIFRLEYLGPDSEDMMGVEEIANCKNGVWEKS